jgi:hypothetical protein
MKKRNIVITLIVIAAVGGSAWWFINRKGKAASGSGSSSPGDTDAAAQASADFSPKKASNPTTVSNSNNDGILSKDSLPPGLGSPVVVAMNGKAMFGASGYQAGVLNAAGNSSCAKLMVNGKPM